jgi:serine/threonine-protein kinase HipA
MKKAEIRIKNRTAGWLTQDENGYTYIYDTQYLQSTDPEPVSLTLPLKETPYADKVLFPFFDGLIPEGWLLEIAENNWKLNQRDRMGLLLACCKDCIGAVSVHPVNEEEI